jgi:hypothetical protein
MKLVLALALLGLLAGPGSARAARSPESAAARIDSGVRGKVLYGPTCPVERQGEQCVRPYDATLHIRRLLTHRLVATVRSGDDGHFRVRLAPGRYVIEPVSKKPYPHAAPLTVVVKRHRFTRVTINYDSGIR